MPPRPSPAHSQMLHLIGALAVLIGIGAVAQGRATTVSTQAGLPASIAVEHDRPLTLTISIGEKSGKGIATVAHDGSGQTLVSLPEDWALREVRGAAMRDVTSDPASFGSARWHVPARASLSFILPHIPKSLTVHNPSGAPLQIKTRRIDLTSGTVVEDAHLVKDRPTRVW